jgi:hypothetical protein
MHSETDRLKRIDARYKTMIEAQDMVHETKLAATAARKALEFAELMLSREIGGTADDCPLFEDEDEEDDQPSTIRAAV